MAKASFQTSEDLTRNVGFLDKPGVYHCVCELLELDPRKNDGTPYNGFGLHFCVLTGTPKDKEFPVADLIGKKKRLDFSHPKASSKDQGKFARQKISQMLVALSLANPNDTGREIEFDTSDAMGRQFIVRLEESSGTDGKTYLDLSFDNIYHVDDPNAPACSKSQLSLDTIPANLRRKPEDFGGSSRGTNGKAPPAPTAQTTAPLSAVDVNSL